MAERVQAIETWAEGHDKQDDARWTVLVSLLLFALALFAGAGGYAFSELLDNQQQQLRELRQMRVVDRPPVPRGTPQFG